MAVEGLPVRLSLGENRVEGAVEAEIVYVSPGYPWMVPAVPLPGVKGSPCADLPSYSLRAPIVGITGSSGETTTTSLVGEILQAAGRHIFVGGNMGVTP